MHRLAVEVGVNPIVWSNDDFHDLGGGIPLEQCLREAREAGFTGIELGRKFPREAQRLRALLHEHGLRLVSGWHSLHLLEAPLEDEERRLDAHLELLAALGSRVAIVAECSRRVYHDPAVPLRRNGSDALAGSEWTRLAAGLEALATRAAGRGMRLAYHHHMGTVVQTAGEIDELMGRTRRLALLLDTGHLAFAGEEPRALLRAHAPRVAHVHLKDVRPAVVREARAGAWSFARAVRAGVFTVPGDGGIDFAPLFEVLAEQDYRGWLVVEAEQDPESAAPARFARMGREFVRRAAGA